MSGSAAVITQFFAAELFNWQSTVYRERRIIEAADIVSIHSADMNLEIYSHSGSQIIIDYIGETALLTEKSDFEVRIGKDEDFSFSLFSLDRFNYNMRVGLPVREYKELRLTSASGNISAERVHAGQITVTSRSGNVTLFSVSGFIDINTRFGDVNTEFVSFADACRIDTETGSVTVVMPDVAGVDLSFFTQSGSFSSDFFGEAFLEAARFQEDLYLSSGVNHKMFTVRTNTGNLVFYKRIEFID